MNLRSISMGSFRFGCFICYPYLQRFINGIYYKGIRGRCKALPVFRIFHVALGYKLVVCAKSAWLSVPIIYVRITEITVDFP